MENEYSYMHYIGKLAYWSFILAPFIILICVCYNFILWGIDGISNSNFISSIPGFWLTVYMILNAIVVWYGGNQKGITVSKVFRFIVNPFQLILVTFSASALLMGMWKTAIVGVVMYIVFAIVSTIVEVEFLNK